MSSKVRSGNEQPQPLPMDKGPPEKKSDKVSKVSTKSSNENGETAISSLLSKLPELNQYFHIHSKIGEGTFSNVYLASLKCLNNDKDKRFAIKHLIPTCHPRRIKYELDCLTFIGGKDNVVPCSMSLREADCVVFIMPYLQHQKFGDYVLDMTVEEARLYMYNLLLALRRVHSFNIIHRDIKPSNFLYNRDSKQFLLVDFGLAQKVTDFSDNSPKLKAIPKPTVLKRKREDDDSENSEKPMAKRSALQTLSADMMNQQPQRSSSGVARYSKQPLSQQQRVSVQAQEAQARARQASDSSFKRLPLSSNSSNLQPSQSSEKPQFMSLMPHKSTSVQSGSSYVRVQNSQVQTSLFPRPSAPVQRRECDCDGRPQVCNLCLTRKPQLAPRAGTPGFRPPEVLLKYPHQTTAVDMWAAGVIFLCILSGCYPFFRSPDDIAALSELITVFGSSTIINLAKKLGRNVICRETRNPINLKLLCENLRRRKVDNIKNEVNDPKCPECHHLISAEFGCLCESRCKLDLSQSMFPAAAYHLLERLLDVNPDTRISAQAALNHPFITAQ